MIVILSLAGIVIESLSSSNKLLINPTVARSLRVLRIIRVLKLVKLAKGVRSLLDTLFEALPQSVLRRSPARALVRMRISEILARLC